MPMLTSANSPLVIAEVAIGPGAGRLGLTLCPGKCDSRWARDLEADLATIRAWGATVVVTLIDDNELLSLAVPALGAAVERLGMHWWHLPIRDVDVPDQRFAAAWPLASADIHVRLDRGERVLIHCRGGLGRTGLVAGVVLVERGAQPAQAIAQVRTARPGAIETRAQETFVLKAAAAPVGKR